MNKKIIISAISASVLLLVILLFPAGKVLGACNTPSAGVCDVLGIETCIQGLTATCTPGFPTASQVTYNASVPGGVDFSNCHGRLDMFVDGSATVGGLLTFGYVYVFVAGPPPAGQAFYFARGAQGGGGRVDATDGGGSIYGVELYGNNTQNCGPGGSPPVISITSAIYTPDDGGGGGGGGGGGATCGNSIVEQNEACDTGIFPGPLGVGCGPGEACGSRCQCYNPAVCGNGTPDSGEQCDTGAFPYDGVTGFPGANGVGGCDPGNFCQQDCQCDSSCGNGTPDSGEQCDTGTSPFDGVSGFPGPANVECPVNNYCANGCTCKPLCGNGLVNSNYGEMCDTGTYPYDGVTGFPGQINFECPANNRCERGCQCNNVCGNGTLEPGEECDPTGPPTCHAGSSCGVDCKCTSTCGDNMVQAGEECDGTDDTLCPGECFIPGSLEECKCDTTACSQYCGGQTYTRSEDNVATNYISGMCSGEYPTILSSSGSSQNLALKNQGKKNPTSNLATKLVASIGSLWNWFKPAPEPQLQIVTCSDFYNFGSVKFENLQVKTDKLNAGDTLSVTTDIINKNDYPIANGMVFAQIHRQKDKTNAKTDAEAQDYLVDEFVAVPDVNIWANEDKQVKFDWAIPKNAIGGRYNVALFFASSKQFNLAGYSFFPSVFGKFFWFDVKGQKTGLWLDSGNVKFNGEKIKVADWVPQVKQGDDVSVSVPLVSTLGLGQANVSLELYDFDLLNKENKLPEYLQIKEVSLAPKAQALDFKLSGLKAGTYLVKITAEGAGQKSFINFRFNIPGDKGRFVFSGLEDFSFKKGDKITLFSCFQNGGDSLSSFSGKVSVELKDKKTGIALAKMNYAGTVSPQNTGIKQEFIALADGSDLLLNSQITDEQGNLMNGVATEYNINSFSKKPAEKNKSFVFKIILLVFCILLLLAVFYFFFLKKWPKGKSNIKNSLIIIIVLFFLSPFSAGKVYATLDWYGQFRCDGGTAQPACKYYYDTWTAGGVNFEPFELRQDMDGLFSADPTAEKSSNGATVPDISASSSCAGTPCPTGFVCGTTGDAEDKCIKNVSSQETITETRPPVDTQFPVAEGTYISSGGYVISPAVNWVDNTGIDGSGVYYSDPTRKSSQYANIDDESCLVGIPDFTNQLMSDFVTWCNNKINTPYTARAPFNQPTYWLPYLANTIDNGGGNSGGIGLVPKTWGEETSAACIGTQITCDRTKTITVDNSKMICTLTNTSDALKHCTTDGTGTCSLKGLNVISSCTPRAGTTGGETPITIEYGFDCYAYMDTGVFVAAQRIYEQLPNGYKFRIIVSKQKCHGLYIPMKLINGVLPDVVAKKNNSPQKTLADILIPRALAQGVGVKTWYYDWEDKGQAETLCEPNDLYGTCWCLRNDYETSDEGNGGIIAPPDTSSLTKTYYVKVVNSAGSISSQTVQTPSLPMDVTFTCDYSEMYPSDEGTPTLGTPTCGGGGTYVTNSGSCNDSGVCTFICHYSAGTSTGVNNVSAQISNSEKFATCSGTLAVDNCGNNIIEGAEQCDGTADSACPGQCIAKGQTNQCKCPLNGCTLAPSSAVQKGVDAYAVFTVNYYNVDNNTTLTLNCGAGSGATTYPASYNVSGTGEFDLECYPYDTLSPINNPFEVSAQNTGATVKCEAPIAVADSVGICTPDASNQTIVQSGENATFKFTYQGMSTGTVGFYGTPNCGDSATLGAHSCNASGCTFTCNNYTGGGLYAVTALIQNGTSATALCSTTITVLPSVGTCVADAGNPTSAPLNGSATFAFNYHNMGSTGTLGFSAPSCGDGASSSSASCDASKCYFTCGLYSTAGTFNIPAFLINKGDTSAQCPGSTITVASNNPPSVSDMRVDSQPCSGQLTLHWKYNDSDNDDEKEYHLQVSQDENFDTKTYAKDFTVTAPPVHTGADQSSPTIYMLNELPYGSGPYYWRVRVCDNRMSPAECQNAQWYYYVSPIEATITGPGDTFTIPAHAYPSAGFKPPAPSSVPLTNGKADVTFDSSDSRCFGTDNVSATCTYLWDFGDISNNSSTDANPSHLYTSSRTVTKTIKLTVTDTDKYSCSTSKDLKLQAPGNVPEWREISPF